MEPASVDLGNLSIAASVSGDPSWPALLLLHGWPHSRAVYDAVLDRLGERLFVVAVDLPDVGESIGAPLSAEKTVLAGVVLDAAGRLGAHKPVVCGFDVGGMIAFAAARDHGGRIAGAVVANTVVPGIEPWSVIIADPRIWHFAFHAVPNLPETLVAGRERAYFDFFIDILSKDSTRVPDALREAFVRAYRRPEALKTGFDWYRALPEDARTNSRHKRIDTPILYLRGDADAAKIEDYVEGFRTAGAQDVSSQIIPDCGEFLPQEAPDAFVAEVLRFCAANRV